LSNHGGNIEEIIRRYGVREKDIIDFSANINPLGPSPKVIKILRENLNRIVRYPDPEARELKAGLSRYLKVKTGNIIVGNGAMELIYLICRLFRDAKALVVVPTFSEYESALKNIGCRVRFLPLRSKDAFRLDVGRLLKAIGEVDILFLCNPNNPTGQLVSKTDMLKVIDMAAKKKTFVVADEVFMDFVPGEREETLIPEATRSNLFVIRSLTKFFALPGLRIGYGIGNEKLLERMKAYQEYWSVNLLAQAAGVAALQDKEYIRRTKKIIPLEREFLYHKLSCSGSLEPYPSVTNYLFCRLRSKINSTGLQKTLIRKNILIRDCSTFRTLNDRYIRIAVKARRENLRLINLLSL
jgi:threonine-phosphate decarboxylase